jgi:hypothetical protein
MPQRTSSKVRSLSARLRNRLVLDLCNVFTVVFIKRLSTLLLSLLDHYSTTASSATVEC